MCEWLGVSKSGFYEWRSNPGSATAKRREELKLFIRKAFDDADGTYGYRRVHAQLLRWGVQCGDELVRALMRELGLVPCQVRRRRSLTVQAAAGPIPDLVGRDFTAEKPGEKMVGDISAPRGALPYRPRSGRRQEEVSSGLMALPGTERRREP